MDQQDDLVLPLGREKPVLLLPTPRHFAPLSVVVEPEVSGLDQERTRLPRVLLELGLGLHKHKF